MTSGHGSLGTMLTSFGTLVQISFGTMLTSFGTIFWYTSVGTRVTPREQVNYEKSALGTPEEKS